MALVASAVRYPVAVSSVATAGRAERPVAALVMTGLTAALAPVMGTAAPVLDGWRGWFRVRPDAEPDCESHHARHYDPLHGRSLLWLTAPKSQPAAIVSRLSFGQSGRCGLRVVGVDVLQPSFGNVRDLVDHLEANEASSGPQRSDPR
jgi:hypothetical protein